jgi:hypothetical protein
VAGVVIVAVAVSLGVEQLRDGRTFYLLRSDGSSARMGAMVLANGPRVEIEPGGLAYTPGVLRSFITRFGASPIDTEAQLAAALPESRSEADQLLAAADVRLAGRLRGCWRLPGGGALPRPPVTVVTAVARPGSAQLVRFAPPGGGSGFTVRPSTTAFGLRRDAIRRPWRLAAPPGAEIRVCFG